MPSSMVSPPNGRVPARKRLGLKLNAAADSQTETAPAQPSTTSSIAPALNGGLAYSPASATSPPDVLTASSKRKFSAAPAGDHPTKKSRKENPDTPNTKAKIKTPKSVSFAAEPQELAPPTPTTNGQKIPKKPKQKKEIPSKTPKGTKPNVTVKPLAKKQNTGANLQSAIEYLRQWHSSRDAWKFNKNHQTRLLEYVFSDEATIPAVDINIFYEYIRPLKGFVRKRLRQTAEEVKRKDMEQGAEGFSSSNKEVSSRKQKEYEELVAGFLKEGRTPEKRRFEEVEYVLRTTDMEMQRRVVKRMRAEVVLDELSDSDDPETESSTTVTETEPDNTAGEGSSGRQPTSDDGDKRVKLNDGTQRRIRRNKVRTAEVEDDTSSSSEDDSDSESETSSSSSEDSSDNDSDADDAMQVDPVRNDEDTSSSSSSSSSEGSDSEDESSEDDEA
jgi:hypothetical protein